ncbi:uncharacterized protein [Rutidosis leptorrhynchoides]|uniref:uncharacterized protein n=1 Tax=Rutidosis leptorrhynchoides TaxID=125765 RepID=UPI003A9A620E
MSSGGGDSRVSIPNAVRKLIQDVKKTLGSLKYTDDFIYATLKDCDLNVSETCRRLKMVHDVRQIAGKHSVEDVYTMLKECDINANDAAQRLLYIDTFKEVRKKQDRRKTITNGTSEEFKQAGGNQLWVARGGRGTLYSSKAFDDGVGGRNLSSGKEYSVTNPLENVSWPAISANSVKVNNVKHVTDSAVNSNGTPAVSSYKVTPKVSAEVSSHSSKPVPVSSSNIRHICAVGSIKCEIVKRSGDNESNSRTLTGMKFSANQLDCDKPKQQTSDVVVKNQVSESSQPPLLSTQHSSHVVDPIQDKTVFSNKTHSVPEEDSELKISAAKPDVALEKLTLHSHQPVIFPDHLQVPDSYKSQFKFGSLDCIFDDPEPLSVAESIQKNGDVVTEPSLSNQNVPTMAQDQEGEIQDNLLPALSNHALPSEDNNISSDPTALKHDLQTKFEMTIPDGGSLNPVLQNARDYSYGFMPQLMGPLFVQPDVPELQSGSSPVASSLGPTPVTQPDVAGQGSVALSPPLFPYFREPYPNYIPYNPYFPHMYLPHNVHLLNPGLFPQQPPTGNVHVQQAGAKSPAPSQYKQGNNEEVTSTQAKDSNTHLAVQQGEDPQVWAPITDRDIPNIMPNYFYNMAFSPLQAGLYYSSQTMTAQSTTVQPLMYPSFSSFGGPVETMPQPITSHQQQPQHAPQTKLADNETS